MCENSVTRVGAIGIRDAASLLHYTRTRTVSSTHVLDKLQIAYRRPDGRCTGKGDRDHENFLPLSLSLPASYRCVV